MPYVHTARFYPNAGAIAELEQLAVEQTKALQAAGSDARISVCRYGPDYPYFLLASRWPTLAEREAALPKLQPLATAFNKKAAPLMRQPTVTTLSEILANTNPTTPRWVVANEFAPATGKLAELRALMIGAMQDGTTAGRSSTLLMQVAGPQSGTLVRNFSFASMAELETWRASIDFGSDFAKKRDSLLARPLSSSIREVLVSFSS